MTEAQTAATADPVRIEVNARDLFELLARVKPFASRDDTLPTISSVVFEFEGHHLVASATDRYTLAVARLNIGQRIARAGRMLGIESIDAIEKAFRPARGKYDPNPVLTLVFGDESLAVETTATLDGQPAKREAHRWLDYPLVNFRKLLSDAAADTEPSDFDPAFLSRFTAVANDDSVRLWPGESKKPWRVTVGDHFFGLIMPRTFSSRTDDLAAWVPGPVNVAPEPKSSRRGKRAAA